MQGTKQMRGQKKLLAERFTRGKNQFEKAKPIAVLGSAGAILAIFVLLFFIFPPPAYAMHIMEGFLPAKWCLFWGVFALPFLGWGIFSIRRLFKLYPEKKMLFGLVGAFAFVLSALKIPSVTGSCSHPTGVGLGAIIFGPAAMAVMGCIVLIFQALLLAHGGITTLGANTFSMGIAGPLVSFALYRICLKLRLPLAVNVFLASALGDLATYLVTSFQLAAAFPDPLGGMALSFAKFASVFAFTQIPLAAGEGLLTVMVFKFLIEHSRQELEELGLNLGNGSPLAGGEAK